MYPERMSKTPRTRGRPRKPEANKRKHSISVWLEADAKERIEKAAAGAGDPTGRWLGKVGDDAARRALASLGIE